MFLIAYFFYSLGGKSSENLAIAMMATGVGTVFYWRLLGYGEIIYEIAPGIVAGISVYVISRLFVSKKRPS